MTHVPGNGWTEYDTKATHMAALEHAQGCYQLDLLDGNEALSGSTLAGKARLYGGHYMRSQTTLLARLRAAGFSVCERRGNHNKRILCIAEGA